MSATTAPVTPASLSTDDRRALLRIARLVLADRSLAGNSPEEWERRGLRWSPALDGIPRGVFVTLRSPDGELRGCIGTLRASDALGLEIARYAVAAAFEDPRFPPVSVAEVGGLQVHLSILGPDRPIGSPDEIELGRDGVVLQHPHGRAVFLPEVAIEAGWGRETLLDRLARKAGLAATAWREPGARLFAFRTEAFGEEEAE